MGIHFRVQVYFSLSLKVVAAWRSVVLIRDLMSIWCLYLQKHFYHSQFNSVVQSCPTLCDPMNHSTPDLPVHHQLPEFIQTHTHWVSVMSSNRLILCCPLLLPPSIFPSIRILSNESVLHVRWPKYWSFSFNISPFSEHPGLIVFCNFIVVLR